MQTTAPCGGGCAADERAAREEQLAARRPAVEVGRRAGAADAKRGVPAGRDDVVEVRVGVRGGAQRRPAGGAQQRRAVGRWRAGERGRDGACLVAGRAADGDDRRIAGGRAVRVHAGLRGRRRGRGAEAGQQRGARAQEDRRERHPCAADAARPRSPRRRFGAATRQRRAPHGGATAPAPGAARRGRRRRAGRPSARRRPRGDRRPRAPGRRAAARPARAGSPG